MLPRARIPIIKLTIPPSPTSPLGMACDIGFGNQLAIANTNLLLTYVMCDARLRTMVLFSTSGGIAAQAEAMQSKSGPSVARSTIRTSARSAAMATPCSSSSTSPTCEDRPSCRASAVTRVS